MLHYCTKSLKLAYFSACKFSQRKLRSFNLDFILLEKECQNRLQLYALHIIAEDLVILGYNNTKKEKEKIKNAFLKITQVPH